MRGFPFTRIASSGDDFGERLLTRRQNRSWNGNAPDFIKLFQVVFGPQDNYVPQPAVRQHRSVG